MSRSQYRPDHYYTYDEMVDYLHAVAREFPDLVTVESIGDSIEGRALWAVTVTDLKGRPPEDKPAVYIDACIHAGEVSGTQVCLHTIDHLTKNFGADEFLTELLRSVTFYILPRTNPDGAEYFLTTPSKQWGSARPYPREDCPRGLRERDMDGDGEILLMRYPDPNGEWKISDLDPRLMIARAPEDMNGDFYAILPEGELIGGAEPDDFRVLPREYQLNLNRNFPAGWEPDALQPGGGEYPLSEPECRAVVEFIQAHPNIVVTHAYHTYGGLLMRPFGHLPDSEFHPMDLLTYQRLGEMGERITGYPMVSVYESFTPDKKNPRRGVLHDWSYNHKGQVALGTEIWNLASRAGITRGDPENHYPFQDQSEEDEARLLRFNDEQLQGEGFVDWTPFEHPQLGSVEIGGWKIKFTRKNPPPSFLEDECRRNTAFNVTYPASLPQIQMKSLTVTPLDGKLVRIRVVVENAGYLPTNVTDMAVKMNEADPVTARIDLPEGAELVDGEQVSDLGHLPGRMRRLRGFFFNEPESGIPKRTAATHWIVDLSGCNDREFSIRVGCPRAGWITERRDLATF
ncbi:MAG: M14 family metallopeptidase [Clostridia bacterium]